MPDTNVSARYQAYVSARDAFHITKRKINTLNDVSLLLYVVGHARRDLVAMLVEELKNARDSSGNLSIPVVEFLQDKSLGDALGTDAAAYLEFARELGKGSHVWLAQAIQREFSGQYDPWPVLVVDVTPDTVVFRLSYNLDDCLRSTGEFTKANPTG